MQPDIVPHYTFMTVTFTTSLPVTLPALCLQAWCWH